MTIRLTDDSCLRPRLLDRPGRPAQRVQGLLRRSGEDETPRFVDAVDYDGQQCRYRTIDKDRGAHAWVVEQAGDEYRSCAQAIVHRLRTLGQDQPDCLSVIDSALTCSGRLWIAIRNDAQRSSRWIALSLN